MEPRNSDPPSRSFKRRDFLKTSLAGTIALGAAGFLARCARPETARPAGLLLLDAAEFRTLTAFAEAVLPGSDADSAVRATPSRIDRELVHWSAKSQAQVREVLALVESGTRYFLFSWRPFSELSMAERQAYLGDWETSAFDFRRTAFQALRMLALFYYYSQDVTWKAIGYDGPWIKAAMRS